MGPQLNRCGNILSIFIFIVSPIRFNGAATKPLRKQVNHSKIAVTERRLQWGRN